MIVTDWQQILVRSVIVALVAVAGVIGAHYGIITGQIATGIISAVAGWAIGHTTGTIQRRNGG
jgi:large-conductance mechanosensitive channel